MLPSLDLPPELCCPGVSPARVKVVVASVMQAAAVCLAASHVPERCSQPPNAGYISDSAAGRILLLPSGYSCLQSIDVLLQSIDTRNLLLQTGQHRAW
jgi:hypothetical protein